MADLCKHCGKPASEHHFFAEAGPKGCVCDLATWGTARPIPPVCDEYKPDVIERIDRCSVCAHAKACHAPKD